MKYICVKYDKIKIRSTEVNIRQYAKKFKDGKWDGWTEDITEAQTWDATLFIEKELNRYGQKGYFFFEEVRHYG